MAAETSQAAGSFETPRDAGTGEAGLVRLWLQAIALQDKAEGDWRKAALDVINRYRLETPKGGKPRGKGYPILYANTETLIPAIYNSPPIPDVRRRYGDGDDDGNPARKAAQVLERALSHCGDEYDMHSVIKDAVQDGWLPGRGVTRVRYEPMMDPAEKQVIYHKTWAEHVAWPDFRMGPSRRWPGVPWMAFRHLLTRKQLIGLNKDIGRTITLDHAIDGTKAQDGQSDVPDVFKRGLVWEIWNKEDREVIWIAPAYPEGPLLKEPDRLGLEQFFPIPRPLQAIQTTDTLIPIEPFRIYKDQADELDRVTKRINSLIEVCKARGIYDAAMAGAFGKLKDLNDGEFAPATGDEANKFTMGNGLDKAIWFYPIDVVSDVLVKLYENREQIKAVIFELTGIADIMRGSTKAQETKGAQELKTQWGTLRIQPAQQEVQRYARDLMRLKAEIIGEKYDPQTLTMITGIDCMSPQVDPNTGQPMMGPDGQPVPNPIPALLKSDKRRSYLIDIETDSTIRGDVARMQEQIARFVEGSGAFFTSMGPAVEAGVMDAATGLTLYTSFARTFKLGKDAEDALDGLVRKAQEQAKQPPPPDPEQAKVQAEQQKMQMEAQLKQAEMQANMQAKQAELELKKQEMAAKLQFEQQKMELEAQKHQQQMEMDQAKHGADMQMKGQELQLKEREGQMKAQLEAAKIADGQMARQEEREMIDAGQMQVPKGQRAMAFMDETREGLKVASEKGDKLGEIVQQVMQMIAQMKADNDDTFEAERVKGADGKLAGIRKRYASGRTVEIPIR